MKKTKWVLRARRVCVPTRLEWFLRQDSAVSLDIEACDPTQRVADLAI